MTMNPLLCAIEEMESNAEEMPRGFVLRPWVEAGRLLAICQRCERWDKYGCHDVDVRPGPFALCLCDASRRCERWP